MTGSRSNRARSSGSPRRPVSNHHRSRLRAVVPVETDGQLGVVGQRGPGADEDGVGRSAEEVGVGACLNRRDPLGFPVGSGHLPIESGGELEGHERPSGPAVVEISGVDFLCVDAWHAHLDVETRFDEPANASTSHAVNRDRWHRRRPGPPLRRELHRHREASVLDGYTARA